MTTGSLRSRSRPSRRSEPVPDLEHTKPLLPPGCTINALSITRTMRSLVDKLRRGGAPRPSAGSPQKHGGIPAAYSGSSNVCPSCGYLPRSPPCVYKMVEGTFLDSVRLISATPGPRLQAHTTDVFPIAQQERPGFASHVLPCAPQRCVVADDLVGVEVDQRLVAGPQDAQNNG